MFLDGTAPPLACRTVPTTTQIWSWILDAHFRHRDLACGNSPIEFHGLHVGMSAALGSIFFDDLSITNVGVAPPPPPPPPVVTNQFQAVIANRESGLLAFREQCVLPGAIQ